MTETVVNFLVNKLTPLLLEQAKQLGGLREEVAIIRDELDQMKAFLRVAEAAEEINTDQHLKTWMIQVRDAAYDTEDVLNEFMLRFGHSHGKGIYGFLRKIACSIKTVRARHRLTSQVQGIKSRVNHMAEARGRYCEQLNITEQGSSSSSIHHASYDYRDDALLLEEAQLVGIDEPKKQLIDWLVNKDPQLKVISVVGMGGIGKTTLAKMVYDDTIVKTSFQSHVWITVSESFKIDELLKDMIKQLFEEAKKQELPGLDTMNLNNLKMEIKTFLLEKKYVVFLDDIWKIEGWQAIKYAFPDCNSGSRVLITTRKTTLASLCGNDSYNLEPLPLEQSWKLFCNKTFRGKSCPKHLERISRSIWKRCGGLPLALVIVGGLLSSKDPDDINEWERMSRNLSAELEENDWVQSINRILLLSYIELPHQLKLCFVYLSIFPEGFIDHWKLIRLWVAEGFVTEKDRLTLEEVAEGYLKQLVGRNLIQVAKERDDGRVKSYGIHDLWREIILKKAMENNIVTIVKEKQRILSDNVRRLSIQNDLENVTEWEGLNRLRSLLMFAKINSMSNQQMLKALLYHSRLIKVLDMSGMPMEILPNEIVKAQHLRYLCLRGTKIRMLPKSIGELQNLETLDLKGTLVTELPDEILKLQKLRHLMLYRYKGTFLYPSFSSRASGFKAPLAIGRMLSLQKLSMMDLNGDSDSMILRELGKLTQLRRLIVLNVRSEDGMILCSSLSQLNSLLSLGLTSTGEDHIIDLDYLSSPPQFLRRLLFGGRLEKLPRWIPSLRGLKRLVLIFCKLEDDNLFRSLQDLPLTYLWLDQAYEGNELHYKAEGFQRLEYLHICRLKGFVWVSVEQGAMPLLKTLIIHKLELRQLPLGFEHLANIEYAEFGDIPHQLTSRMGRDPEGEDYWKIAHIPIVWIGDTNDGEWKGDFIKRSSFRQIHDVHTEENQITKNLVLFRRKNFKAGLGLDPSAC